MTQPKFHGENFEITESLKKRIWSKVQKDEITGCWNWTGTKIRKGYGKISIKSKLTPVHRVAYVIAKGAIPEGLFVLHKCDNPSCINPDHLWIGTNQDNIRDCAAKGRLRGGRRPGKKNNRLPANSKYTEEQIKQVKKMLIRGFTSGEIRKEFDIAEQTVYAIRQGRTFEYITLTREEVKEAWKMQLPERTASKDSEIRSRQRTFRMKNVFLKQ